MAAFESCPKHNMVAYLEKTEGNAQFHEIVDFLSRSSIFYALTVSPNVSTSLIEQFWNSAVSQTVNNVSQIKATISGQTVLISESSIRRDLLFNDDNGIDCLTVADIYENLPLMGYEGDLTTLTFQKALFSPQWKYLIHTIIHCLSSKSTSWDQFPTNVASAVICLATDRTFNFSKMIFDGMNRNLEAKKKFLMYPRFVQVFLNNQLQNIPAPLDNFPIPVLSKKVFTNMTRKGLHFSGHVTPLFPTMLVPAVVEEGEESSYRPDNTHSPSINLEGTGRSEGDQVQLPHDSPLSGGHTSDRAEGGLNLEELFVLCTNLSNRVLILETYKDAQAVEILKLKTRIKKLKKKCKPIISHHRAWLRSVSILSMNKKLGKKESVSKQGRKKAKPGPTLDDSAFDDLDVNLAYGMDYMETEEAVNEGRQISTVAPEVSTVNISTGSRPEVSTATLMTLPTTTSVFDNEDITLAETLLKIKDDKAKLKGVATKEVEESDLPARSVLTLKPLIKIDPKDKGKGILEEEPEPVKKLKKSDLYAAQLAMDEEVARQVNAEWQAELERERVAAEEATQTVVASDFDEIQARINADTLLAERLQEEEREKFTSIQDFVPIGSAEDERLIEKMNKKAAGEDTSKKEKVLEEPDSTKMEVKQEEVEESTRKGSPRMKRMSKRRKTDSDLEEEEHLKTFLKIVPDEEERIDYEVLEKRFPIINWESKFYHYDRHGAEALQTGPLNMIKSLDGLKLFSENGDKEGVDLVLWGDLRTVFDANAKDELWQNQERWNLKSWDFYENCWVHTLILEDGTKIHMLVERKYLLIKETLNRMMSLKLVLVPAQHQELASLEQTTSGKDFSNPLMADNLPKPLDIPVQTATGKETSNPFMLVVCQKLTSQLSCVAVLRDVVKDTKTGS
ncbi:hypothetical protein Tco_0821557 [Tanacetum coccineum]|uniref:Synaptobrevin, longin-like domain protein n=1 Tax=Tanacetum coccineum TaxID=301880 RepID=A0ABQ5AGP8_9ASTR